MNVIDNIKKIQQENEKAKYKKDRNVIFRENSLISRVMRIFGKDPAVRSRNISFYFLFYSFVFLHFYMFSVWGVVMFASSVFLMDKYGIQFAI